jgi:hypothetical protein
MVLSSVSPEVSIKSSFLALDGFRLRADVLDIPDSTEKPVSPDALRTILHMGEYSIHSANQYRIWVVRLGNTEQTDGKDSQVLTVAGYENGSGVFGSVDEIRKPFHDYWHIIEAAGYVPEVRLTTGNNTDGSWILLGNKADET